MPMIELGATALLLLGYARFKWLASRDGEAADCTTATVFFVGAVVIVAVRHEAILQAIRDLWHGAAP